MICGVTMKKTTKKILLLKGTKIIPIQELRISQDPEVDQDLEIDADQDILGHVQVPGHLHPAEDEEKIDPMGEDIDHDHLAVAHQDRDQGQDILVEAQEDIPLPLGQGGKVR